MNEKLFVLFVVTLMVRNIMNRYERNHSEVLVMTKNEDGVYTI